MPFRRGICSWLAVRLPSMLPSRLRLGLLWRIGCALRLLWHRRRLWLHISRRLLGLVSVFGIALAAVVGSRAAVVGSLKDAVEQVHGALDDGCVLSAWLGSRCRAAGSREDSRASAICCASLGAVAPAAQPA